MNSEEVIKIINEIGSRIGATTHDLYPKLVKYGIMSNSLGFILAFLSFVVSVFILKKYAKEVFEMSDFLSFFSAVIGLVIFIVSFVYWVFFIYHLFLWIFCPEMQAIDYIMQRI